MSLALFRDSHLLEVRPAILTLPRSSSKGLRPCVAATPLDDELSRQTDRYGERGGVRGQ